MQSSHHLHRRFHPALESPSTIAHYPRLSSDSSPWNFSYPRSQSPGIWHWPASLKGSGARCTGISGYPSEIAEVSPGIYWSINAITHCSAAGGVLGWNGGDLRCRPDQFPLGEHLSSSPASQFLSHIRPKTPAPWFPGILLCVALPPYLIIDYRHLQIWK